MKAVIAVSGVVGVCSMIVYAINPEWAKPFTSWLVMGGTGSLLICFFGFIGWVLWHE